MEAAVPQLQCQVMVDANAFGDLTERVDIDPQCTIGIDAEARHPGHVFGVGQRFQVLEDVVDLHSCSLLTGRTRRPSVVMRSGAFPFYCGSFFRSASEKT